MALSSGGRRMGHLNGADVRKALGESSPLDPARRPGPLRQAGTSTGRRGLNKILKDLGGKNARSMVGHNAVLQWRAWDLPGLPIEHQVDKEGWGLGDPGPPRSTLAGRGDWDPLRRKAPALARVRAAKSSTSQAARSSGGLGVIRRTGVEFSFLSPPSARLTRRQSRASSAGCVGGRRLVHKGVQRRLHWCMPLQDRAGPQGRGWS